MKVLRNLSWTRVSALFAVAAILSGGLMSHAAMAQGEKAVENFPTVLQRDITLWSDGTLLPLRPGTAVALTVFDLPACATGRPPHRKIPKIGQRSADRALSRFLWNQTSAHAESLGGQAASTLGWTRCAQPVSIALAPLCHLARQPAASESQVSRIQSRQT